MHCIKILRNFARISSLEAPHKLTTNKIIYQVHPSLLFSSSLDPDDDTLTDKIVKDVCGEDKDLEKKLRILMLEVQVMREDGRRAPNHLDLHHWKELVLLKSKSQRINYLLYLFKREKSKENEKAKKLARAAERSLLPVEDPKEFPDDIMYGIRYYSNLLRVRSHSIDNFYNYRMIQSMLYGQKIVLDCSYDDNMVPRENKNASKQVTSIFAENRIHKNPFNIFMCGVKNNGYFMQYMRKNIPCVEENWFPMNIHTESYLDLFPKEKLVYLTPDANTELTKFNHDDIYIVGCLVDKVNNDPLSLAKAKKEKIRMARLPLEKHVDWGLGKKTLNVNHMISILLDLKATGDWTYALRHLPRRKLMEFQMHKMQSNPNIINSIRRKNSIQNQRKYFKKHNNNNNKGSIEISKYF